MSMGTWTRSIQRVKGVSVVVDVRPSSGAPSWLPISTGVGSGERGYVCLESSSYGASVGIFVGYIVARRLPEVRERTVGVRVLESLSDVIGRARECAITARIETEVSYGIRDMADLVSRAIRQHLSIEVMGELPAPAPLPAKVVNPGEHEVKVVAYKLRELEDQSPLFGAIPSVYLSPRFPAVTDKAREIATYFLERDPSQRERVPNTTHDGLYTLVRQSMGRTPEVRAGIGREADDESISAGIVDAINAYDSALRAVAAEES